ncbi:recombinase family protein [Lachnospiraceae bacterium ZAX-1]
MLQILSYVAQTECEINRQRQAEGISIALAKGVKFGRQPMERPAMFEE